MDTRYGINLWGDNNFKIVEDLLHIQTTLNSSINLLEIVKEVEAKTVPNEPLLLRFPHLIQKQLERLFSEFNRAIHENSYAGSFHAVFPLKVNHFPHAIDQIIKLGANYHYGLEAGSKAELLIAIDKTPLGAPITVNGFKDEELIFLSFIAAHTGHNITLTIEGITELELIIKTAKAHHLTVPNIGIRLRLHSSGSGIWAKSGGMDAKFGLTSTEIMLAISLLKDEKMVDKLTMLHFHIGSQIEEITHLKRALREAGHIYADLKKRGAIALDNLNIGGGLAVEYAQHTHDRASTYTMGEFCNDVVFLLKEIMTSKGVKHPNIYTESGRYIVASHGVLITPVLELFTHDFHLSSLMLKPVNPPIIEELNALNTSLNSNNSIEFLHDAIDHMESILTLFDLGYVDLQDRSNAEILVHQIIKKSLYLIEDDAQLKLEKLHEKLQERYLINASIFQSLPDYWGLGQRFPIMPIHKLSKKPIRAASLWDITCDSDGEINFVNDNPLFLHDVNLDEEEYYLAFFNVGAYQETLAMQHNLFARPTEAIITFNTTDETFNIDHLIPSQSVQTTLNNFNYNAQDNLNKLKKRLENSDFSSAEEKRDTLTKIKAIFIQSGYLHSLG